MAYQDIEGRGIVPGSLDACEIRTPPWLVVYLLGHDEEWWMRYFIEKFAKDDDDAAFLLAVIFGDPLE